MIGLIIILWISFTTCTNIGSLSKFESLDLITMKSNNCDSNLKGNTYIINDFLDFNQIDDLMILLELIKHNFIHNILIMNPICDKNNSEDSCHARSNLWDSVYRGWFHTALTTTFKNDINVENRNYDKRIHIYLRHNIDESFYFEYDKSNRLKSRMRENTFPVSVKDLCLERTISSSNSNKRISKSKSLILLSSSINSTLNDFRQRAYDIISPINGRSSSSSSSGSGSSRSGRLSTTSMITVQYKSAPRIGIRSPILVRDGSSSVPKSPTTANYRNVIQNSVRSDGSMVKNFELLRLLRLVYRQSSIQLLDISVIKPGYSLSKKKYGNDMIMLQMEAGFHTHGQNQGPIDVISWDKRVKMMKNSDVVISVQGNSGYNNNNNNNNSNNNRMGTSSIEASTHIMFMRANTTYIELIPTMNGSGNEINHSNSGSMITNNRYKKMNNNDNNHDIIDNNKRLLQTILKPEKKRKRKRKNLPKRIISDTSNRKKGGSLRLESSESTIMGRLSRLFDVYYVQIHLSMGIKGQASLHLNNIEQYYLIEEINRALNRQGK